MDSTLRSRTKSSPKELPTEEYVRLPNPTEGTRLELVRFKEEAKFDGGDVLPGFAGKVAALFA